MRTNKNATQCQAQAKNELPSRVVNHHNENLYKTIEDFFDFAGSSDYHGASNEMLNAFLDYNLDGEGDYNLQHLNHVKDVVHMVTFQSKFISELKRRWESFKEVNNLKIEMA